MHRARKILQSNKKQERVPTTFNVGLMLLDGHIQLDTFVRI